MWVEVIIQGEKCLTRSPMFSVTVESYITISSFLKNKLHCEHTDDLIIIIMTSFQVFHIEASVVALQESILTEFKHLFLKQFVLFFRQI